MKASRMSKGSYVFHNENPKGSIKSCDCVVRAISKATGYEWDTVFMGLCNVGLELKDMPNSKPVFKKYLGNLGYDMERQPRKEDNKKYTAEEFADEYNRGIYIISLAKHLSVVIDGKIYDIWNCSKKCVGNYWRVKR